MAIGDGIMAVEKWLPVSYFWQVKPNIKANRLETRKNSLCEISV